jgi:capsular polysaccharide transport system permease protein
LKLERIKAESEIQVNLRSLSPTAPQMRILQARLDAMNSQIASLEKTLTSANAAGDPTLSQSFLRFDKARLDQEWAETYYKMMGALLERAKAEYERQQVYLESFVRPALPQQAEFPRRLWNVFMVAFGSTAIWLALTYMRSYVKG